MTGLATITTPVRRSEHPRFDGCRLLSGEAGSYLDGAEARVSAILSGADDLSADSDELIPHAVTWAEEYHLSPARANVVRALDWQPGWRVLEIGAGCGAVTRFLGEQCALVDAIEPSPDRARVARQRTRDLPGVEVFLGTVGDLPPEPAYDAIVVVGVLEYVAGGRDALEPYHRFLRTVADLLSPSGTLVLAIENRLGVKYLCGASEDHSGRPFDSLEGYGPGSPARTFSRAELASLVSQAGLHPRVIGVFPDYKMASVLISEELIATEPSLAERLPRFPSPDRAPGPGRVANEARVWASLLAAGLGPEVPNSFLLLGSKAPSAEPLWPTDLLAAYYTPTSWRAEYFLETRVRRDADTLTFERRRLPRWADSTSMLQQGSNPMVDGEDLLAKMAGSPDDGELRALLQAWLDALPHGEAAQTREIDALPHNAVIDAGGRVTFVDSKWVLPDYTRADVVARGALLTAHYLAALTPPERWPVLTVEGLTLHVGALLGLAANDDWLHTALQREARFQAALTRPPVDGGTSEAAAFIERLQAELATPLAEVARLPGSDAHQRWWHEEELRRADLMIAGARQEVEGAAQRAESAVQHAASATRRAAQAEARVRTLSGELLMATERAEFLADQLAALEHTKVLRFSAPARRVYGRLRGAVARDDAPVRR